MAATVASASHSSFRTRFRCFKRPPTEPRSRRRAQVAPDARAHSPRTGSRRATPEIEHADRRRWTTALLVVPFRVWRRPRNPRPFSRPSSTLTLMTIPIRRDPTHRKMDLGQKSQSPLYLHITICPLQSRIKLCNEYRSNPRDL